MNFNLLLTLPLNLEYILTLITSTQNLEYLNLEPENIIFNNFEKRQ